MSLFCIDPGTTHSGVIILEPDDNSVSYCNPEYNNEELLQDIVDGHFAECDFMPIEMVASYGLAVGETTFETVLWIGHFMQAFGRHQCAKVYRKDVKLFLCNSLRGVTNANVRQRILDLYPATGGGKTPQIGTKKQPGPLYGVTSHAISALAVGLTYLYSPDYLNLKGGRI